MNRVQASQIVRLKEVLSELNLYADIRQDAIKNQLVLAPLESIQKLQGAYEEVKLFRTLADQIDKALKEST
jgi:hypothetical protein